MVNPYKQFKLWGVTKEHNLMVKFEAPDFIISVQICVLLPCVLRLATFYTFNGSYYTFNVVYISN